MTEAFGMTDTGCCRANNEDYYRLAEDLGLYILADGMGGAKAGEMASELAVETVETALRESGERSAEGLLAAVMRANDTVRERAQSDTKLEGMGTTIVAALDTGEQLLIASVGDSRAYLLENDSFRAVTQDQSWVNEVGRPLGLDEHALRTHPMRNILTMAIGASPNLVVNRYSIPWKQGSMALLSSDGLHGVVRGDLVEAIVKDGANRLDTKCRKLIEAARAAGAPDNVTVVLMRRVN